MPRCSRPSLCIVPNVSPSFVFIFFSWVYMYCVRDAFLCHDSFPSLVFVLHRVFFFFSVKRHVVLLSLRFVFSVVTTSSPGCWDVPSSVFRRFPFFGGRGPIHAVSLLPPEFVPIRSAPISSLPRLSRPLSPLSRTLRRRQDRTRRFYFQGFGGAGRHSGCQGQAEIGARSWWWRRR